MQKNNYGTEDEKAEINVGGNDIFCMKNKMTILVRTSQNFVLFCFVFSERWQSFLVGEKKYLLKLTVAHLDVKCPQISGGTYF